MITIEGYSGCGIRVFRNPDPQASDYILEKSTDSAAYVPRLLLQQKKQSAFSRFNKLPHIVVPKILYMRQSVTSQFSLEEDDNSGLPIEGSAKAQDCALGMQFLHHVDAITFLSKASIRHVKGFSATLLSILDQYVAVSPISDVPSSVFTDKLLDIQRIVQKNGNISQEDREFVCNTVIPSLLDSIGTAPLRLPLGQCHGDLTLSNILVAQQDSDRDGDMAIPADPFALFSPILQATPATTTNNLFATNTVDDGAASAAVTPVKVVLIDFLDNFVESPLADMAKLCQDLKYAWSLRVAPNPSVDVVSFFSVLEFLLKDMEQQYAGFEWYQQYFRLMFVLNQLRVLQYSKEGTLAAYLAGTVREEFSLWSRDRKA